VDRVVERQVSDHLSHQATDDHHGHRGGEEVCRERERPTSLAQPTKVDEEEDQDHTDGDLKAVLRQSRNRRGDGVGPRRRLHGHGDDVVDHQRDGSDLGDHRAEILPRDDVRTARLGVEHDNLPVGQGHQHQDDENDQRHRQQQGVCRETEHRQQDEQDLLRPVRRRGDAVTGQDAQGQLLGQLLVLELVGGQRRTQGSALESIRQALRQIR
jgi:hypothetical protein